MTNCIKPVWSLSKNTSKLSSKTKMSRRRPIRNPLNTTIIQALSDIAFYSDDHADLVQEYRAAAEWVQELDTALYHDWDLLYDILAQWPRAGKFVQTAVIIGEEEAIDDAVAEMPVKPPKQKTD